jgi:hypothetical protein
MIKPIEIDADAIYDDAAVVLAIGIPSGVLARARRAGQLRFRRIGRRTLYSGRWLKEWLTADEREVVHAPG